MRKPFRWIKYRWENWSWGNEFQRKKYTLPLWAFLLLGFVLGVGAVQRNSEARSDDLQREVDKNKAIVKLLCTKIEHNAEGVRGLVNDILGTTSNEELKALIALSLETRFPADPNCGVNFDGSQSEGDDG